MARPPRAKSNCHKRVATLVQIPVADGIPALEAELADLMAAETNEVAN
jgi:Asp/Glu/hydantoin racemase